MIPRIFYLNENILRPGQNCSFRHIRSFGLHYLDGVVMLDLVICQHRKNCLHAFVICLLSQTAIKFLDAFLHPHCILKYIHALLLYCRSWFLGSVSNYKFTLTCHTRKVKHFYYLISGVSKHRKAAS